jgi:hypothetical protein
MSAILVLPAVIIPGVQDPAPGVDGTVLEGTYTMLFSRGTAVTPRAAGQHPVVT